MVVVLPTPVFGPTSATSRRRPAWSWIGPAIGISAAQSLRDLLTDQRRIIVTLPRQVATSDVDQLPRQRLAKLSGQQLAPQSTPRMGQLGVRFGRRRFVRSRRRAVPRRAICKPSSRSSTSRVPIAGPTPPRSSPIAASAIGRAKIGARRDGPKSASGGGGGRRRDRAQSARHAHAGRGRDLDHSPAIQPAKQAVRSLSRGAQHGRFIAQVAAHKRQCFLQRNGRDRFLLPVLAKHDQFNYLASVTTATASMRVSRVISL